MRVESQSQAGWAGTIDAPGRAEFEAFWDKQDAVRSVIVIDTLSAVPVAARREGDQVRARGEVAIAK